MLNRWKSYAKQKRERRLSGDFLDTDQDNDNHTVSPIILAVVHDALAKAKAQGKSDAQAEKEGLAAVVEEVSETTSLLAFEPTSKYSDDVL